MDRSIPVVDGHNDRLLAVLRGGRSFLGEGPAGHLSLALARAGGFAGGLFAICPPEDPERPEPPDAFQKTERGYRVRLARPLRREHARSVTLGALSLLADLVERAGGALVLCRTAAEVRGCLARDALAVVVHFEGAEAVAPDLGDLDEWYARGLRSLGLAWSRPNDFATGVPFRFPEGPDVGPGLTPAGRALVRACNRLGLVVDLAHLNERGFFDVAGSSDAPLVVSHAAAFALCPSTRNLTDRQLDAVGASGGVVGVAFCAENLRPDGDLDPDTPLEQVVAHVRYLADRMGVDHVALGSDFDGATIPRAIGDAAGLPRLLEALRAAGFDDGELAALAHGNWLRVLDATWKG
jgi:membrane dipeptidase